MLGEILRDMWKVLRHTPESSNPAVQVVLNVGGGTKRIPIPAHYIGWRHLLLDVDPRGVPDIMCDARSLSSLQPAQFDAVYCAHNLEHYYEHEGLSVLRGFLHVLKERGFAEIRVPDLERVIRHAVDRGLELNDVLYESAAGPISLIDVIYGFRREIERTGQDFYAHKTGFSPASLRTALERAGFQYVVVVPHAPAFEVRALAFKAAPTETQRRLLAIDDSISASRKAG